MLRPVLKDVSNAVHDPNAKSEVEYLEALLASRRAAQGWQPRNHDASRENLLQGAEGAGLFGAATLLRFASRVLGADWHGVSTWVVLRAIHDAEQYIRDAVDGGDDMNVVDLRVSAIRLRLGISGIHDIVNLCGRPRGDGVSDADPQAAKVAAEALENAASKCFKLALQAMDHG